MALYNEYNTKNSLEKSLTSVQNRLSWSPNQLINYLNKGYVQKDKILHYYKKPPKTFNSNSEEFVFTNVILAGYIKPISNKKDSFFSKKTNKSPFVLKYHFTSPFFLNARETIEKDWEFVNNNRVNKEIRPFLLGSQNKITSFRATPIECLVRQNPDVEWFFTEDDKVYSKTSKFIKKDKGFFSKFFDIFSKIFAFKQEFVMLGVEEKEFGLKIGCSIGVLGDIIYNRKENSLRIENPIYFFKDKKILLNILKEYFQKSKKKLFLLSGAVLSLFFLKIYLLLSNENSAYRGKHLFPGNEIYTNMDENLSCPICRSKIKSIVLLPCKHLSFCEDCYHRLNEKKRVCPCCKQEFNNFYKIYVV